MIKIYPIFLGSSPSSSFVVPQGHFRWATTCE